jgi:ADP-ribosylglycohydrolase
VKNKVSVIESLKTKIYGCIIGGGIGDALGWPVEFLSNYEIINKYGKKGIVDLVIGKNGKAEISDDTQMALFTAEGILNSVEGGIQSYPIEYIHKSYLNWLVTQESFFGDPKYINNLLEIKELFAIRAPGNTCLDSLKSGMMGTIENPINSSKGCGGVMRVAPIGLIYESEEAFKIACDCAAITHGHPSGYISAGILACIIAEIIAGNNLDGAINSALEISKGYKGYEECYAKINRAIELYKESMDDEAAISELGEGWTGEEALAIAIYCALKYRKNFKKAIIAGVNHDGDSDSTGAITGNILGAYLGLDGIPNEWIKKIELLETINFISDDIYQYKKINFTKKKRKLNKEDKTLTKALRQLIIFHIFNSSKVVEYDDILNLINSIKETSKKTIMRDIKNLQNAGLINVRFSRGENGYIHKDFNNRHQFSPAVISDNKAENRSYEKLIRLGTIMIELKNHREVPYYDEKSKNQETCASWYKKKFPNVSTRTMWRDFKELSNIGYEITYDSFDQCYTIDFPVGNEALQWRLKDIYEKE